MKLVFEATLLLGPRSGVGNYAYHLAEQLCRAPVPEQVCLVANGYRRHGRLPRFPESVQTRYDQAWVPQAVSDSLSYQAWYRWYLGKYVSRQRPDVIHFPSLIGAQYPGCKTAVTIHDLSFEKFYPPSRLTEYYREYGKRSAQSADLVITDSAATRNDLVELWGVGGQKIKVIPLGCSGDFRELDRARCRQAVREKHGVTAPFVLFVGNIEPRKNLVFLLKCFEQVRKMDPGLGLVIAGSRGFSYHDFDAALGTSSCRPAITVLGQLPVIELVELYNAAECLCYPSLMEGFGLPILEAFNCGCPVICADNSSLPEVAGDAAMLLDAGDGAAWTDAIRRIIADETLAAELRAKGRRRAALFSWEQCCRQTVATYQGLL